MGLHDVGPAYGTDRRRVPSSVVWGVLLLLAGVMLLLDYLEVLPGEWIFWAVALAAGAGAFLYVFLTQHEKWWAAIPAGWLLGAAAVTVWEALVANDDRGAALLLGLGGLGFWAVYARRRANWWAVIPGGVLVTLAVMIALEATVSAATAGSVLFFGMAVTFALLAVLPGTRMRWPLIPAAGLTLLGVLTALEATGALELANLVWPVALIAAGGYVIWKAVRPRRPHGPAGA
jgi:hypothetical protein